MPRPSSPSIPEKEFFVAVLQQNLRLDGRSPVELRSANLAFGPDLGWVECSLGKTRYGLGHALGLGKKDGLNVQFSIEFLPMWMRKW